MLPSPGLHLVFDPTDSVEHLQRLHYLTGSDDRLLVTISPGADTKRTVGYDILRALNKDAELVGVDRNSREMWLRAELWLQVSGVTNVFVSRAHLIPPWMLSELASLAIRAGVELWLICQTTALNRGRQEFFASWPFEQMSWDEFVERVPAQAPGEPPTVPLPRPHPAALLPEVPINDFTSFRAACRQLLSADDFAAVDAEFLIGVEQTKQFLAANKKVTESEICEFVRDLIAGIDWMPQLFTRVRGCQVGAFHAGYLMKVQLDILSSTKIARARLDDSAIGILSRYSAPRYGAAAMLLAATGCELDDLTAMNLADVSSDSGEVQVGGKPYALPKRAAAMVEVLVRERLSQRAGDDDPLFVYVKGTGRRNDKLVRWTHRGMYDNLKKVERESGLLLTSHLLNAGQRNAVSWARRRGISLQPIASR